MNADEYQALLNGDRAALRVIDELKRDLAAHKTVIGLLFESLPDCPFMGDLPGYVDAMKARVAELEKALLSYGERNTLPDAALKDRA